RASLSFPSCASHRLPRRGSPARRSSDLIRSYSALATNLLLQLRLARRGGVLGSPHGNLRIHVGFGDRRAVGIFPWGDPRTPPRRDRKSTRLNSSHEWSSYAVSCV